MPLGAVQKYQMELPPSFPTYIVPSAPKTAVEQSGLGEDEGSFELHVPYYKGVPFDGLSSFVREEAANWLNRDRVIPPIAARILSEN